MQYKDKIKKNQNRLYHAGLGEWNIRDTTAAVA